jgi:ABC-2 type transport system permease protein
MSTHVSAMPEPLGSQQTVSPTLNPTRPWYWSIRRELWEHPSIYVAPLAVASVALVAFTFSAIAGVRESPLRLNAAKPEAPYDLLAGLVMFTTMIVNFFYCLDALYSERRDRSILFWKSLPVSDFTTVLAKASIPLVVLPLIAFAITVACQWVMLLVSSLVLLAHGQSIATLWANMSFFRMSLLLLYHLMTAHALWPFPIYCWLLLVSGWSRRAPFLWAILPLVAIAGFEKVAFGTWHFAMLMGSRFIGDAPTVASTSPEMFPTNPMTHITPGALLGSSGLWIGLLLSAAFLAAAVRLRRSQGPI